MKASASSIGDRRLAHAPFDVGRYFVHGAPEMASDGRRGQALRDARRLRITAREQRGGFEMSSLSISAAWDESQGDPRPRRQVARDRRAGADRASRRPSWPSSARPPARKLGAFRSITYLVVVLLGVRRPDCAQPARDRARGDGRGGDRDGLPASPVGRGRRCVGRLRDHGRSRSLLLLILSADGAIVDAGARPAAAASLVIMLLIVLVVLAFAVFQLVFPLAAVETGNPLRLIARSVGARTAQLPAAAGLRRDRFRRPGAGRAARRSSGSAASSC